MMLASQEVRWFFSGGIERYPAMRRWVEEFTPIPQETPVLRPEWKGRLNDRPDVYLLVPDGSDMGIKWREGQLQIKGLLSPLGTQLFSGGHQGNVERWIKWSYEGPSVERAFGHWFNSASGAGPRLVEVYKTRCLRKVRMDPQSSGLKEVAASVYVDRGGNLEVTDLRVGSDSYCSIAFEAFPDDSAMHRDFTTFVKAFLEGLEGMVLSASTSKGYPAWLATLP